MLNLVNVGHKSLADYASITTRGLREEIDALAAPLAGKRVLHLSATAFGGGVAEINYTLVPLMADVGLEVEWRIIQATDGFFDVTKTIHNALQGNPEGLTERPAGRSTGGATPKTRACSTATGTSSSSTTRSRRR